MPREGVLLKQRIDGSDVQQTIFGDSLGGLSQKPADAPKDVVVEVSCTLAEFYNGSIKQVDYSRNEVQYDAKSVQLVRKVQQVEVKPGFSEKSELVFKSSGNQAPGHVNANLVIKFKQADHADYRRVGHDLILTQKISLQEAFECGPCRFRTLDGRMLSVACDEQISPQTCKLVENEGMPIEGTADKGSLYLRFDIQFPSQF